MATAPLISWHARQHLHGEKTQDWYWAVGIITLALAVVCVILGSIITGILIVVAVSALILHVSKPAEPVECAVNDRGIVIDRVLYPFLTLESFWVPHDDLLPRIIVKSHRTFTPLIVIYIEEVDPEAVRQILLKYIAETEHHEPLLKHLIDMMGF